MKVITPEISWHNDIKPVLSIDIHSSGRIATAGADNNVRIWQLEIEEKQTEENKEEEKTDDKIPTLSSIGAKINFIANLSHHSEAANVVRFSPDGQTLASASDGKNLLMLIAAYSCY